MNFSNVLTRSRHTRKAGTRFEPMSPLIFSTLLIVLGAYVTYAQEVNSPPLGFPFPSSVTEDWNQTCTGSADVNEQCHQVGRCISGRVGTSLNCTANDFAITSLELSNIRDGCTGPTDFFMADIAVRFNKQTPARYDPHAWFYRSNNLNDGASDFNHENADNGAYCTRVPLEAGLDIINGGDQTTVLGQTAAAETGNNSPVPDCIDAAISGPAFIEQDITSVILPCRDLTSDGIIDISACTSWDNNTDSPNAGKCDGSQYDGINEPQAGTKSKCGCTEFDGGALQVTIPHMSITKSCVDANDGDTQVSPGKVANCTITLTNSGSGLLDGAISASDEGYSYVDTFPVASTAGGSVSNISITNNNTVGADPTYQNAANVTVDNMTGTLIIYPDNIRGNNGTDGVVTVTYDFTVHATVPLDTETDLTNAVCSSYYDSDTNTSMASDTDCSSTTLTAHVTLGSFYAYRDPLRNDFIVQWSTTTETANLGFNLYVVLGQTRYRLNRQLIASQVHHSTQQVSYTARIANPTGGTAPTFYIEDVNMRDAKHLHGPFVAHQWYGVLDGVASEDVDWASVQEESADKKQQRQAQLSQKYRQLTHRRPVLKGSRHGYLSQGGTADEQLAVKIRVQTAGVHRITYEALVELGLSLQGIDPMAMALQSGGISIPYYLSSGDAQPFGPGSYIEFIGQPGQSLYQPENVYLLTFSGQDHGTRIHSVRGTPKGQNYSDFYMATQTLTRDQLYSFVSPLANDPWHDTWLLASGAPKTKHYSFAPDGFAATAEAGVTIDATFVGGVDWPELREDHHVLLSVNDQFVDERSFDGIDAVHMTVEVPLDLMREGTNAIAITLPAGNAKAIDAVYIDDVKLHYPRHYLAQQDTLVFRSNDDDFKVVGFSEPSLVVYAENRSGTIRLHQVEVTPDEQGYAVAFRSAGPDSTYYVATDRQVLSASLELIERHDMPHITADHLILTHPDFMGPALEAYARERRRWSGGSHQIVDVREVYAHYSYDAVDAEAIKQFIADVHRRSALQSILLVGGDTYDYHNHLGLQSVSFVPTLYRATDQLVRFSPVDAAYGDLDEDGIPEIAIGRLPVRSSTELETITEKLIEYQELQRRQSAVLVADDFQATEGYHFAQASDLLYQPLDQAGWSVTRLYLNDPATGAQLRQTLLEALNLGPALTVFTGHSDLQQWTFDGIFTSIDAASLTNEGQPTTVIQWGCWNTYFVDPKAQTLGHHFLLSGNQGAANVVGASTLTMARHERELSQLLNQALLSGETIGRALNWAKQQYANQFGIHADVMLGINLLGDPLSSVK